MELRGLGNSGLFVSRLGLGTMSWGRDTDIHEARDQFNVYYEAGGRFIDTADIYSDGSAEEIVGEFLRDRPDVVVSSKAGSVRNARRRNASRSHLISALDSSLKRLRRSHIDIWHVNSWDPYTPLDETLSAMDWAVSTGRVRYAGISNFSGWQLAAAATTQATKPARVVAAQMEYSLVERGIEREVVPAALHHGTGILAWSPLGRGVLTGKYRYATPPDSRAASQHLASFVSPYLAERPRAIVDAVCMAAEGLGMSPIDVSLAWVTARPGVASAIVGARTAAQLRAIMAGSESVLPVEIHTALDEVSAPERGYPDFGWNQ